MLNKLDILSGCDEIKLCTGYLVDGTPARWPLLLDELERAEPVYEVASRLGRRSSTEVRDACATCHAAAAAYVERIEELAGVPITLVSVGAERTQTIIRSESAGGRGLRIVGGVARGDAAGTSGMSGMSGGVAHRIVVVGSGARERALAARLNEEDGVEARQVEPAPEPERREQALRELVQQEAIDLVVFGPEGPLVGGVADRLRAAGVTVFGPDSSGRAARGQQGLHPRDRARGRRSDRRGRLVRRSRSCHCAMRGQSAPGWWSRRTGWRRARA